MSGSLRFVFVGNRRFVLEEMAAVDVDLVSVMIASNTHLQRDYETGRLADLKTKPVLFSSKHELIDLLAQIDYDILISNGCPFILPISTMKRAVYANIHPSYLPDLKGIDPVIGAILHQKRSGATCHIMNNEVDAGNIISQVAINYSDDLDVALLYQLSFVAEREAFRMALSRDFKPAKCQISSSTDIYYSRSLNDRFVFLSESNGEIIRKAKAFNNRSQGCFFIYNDNTYKFYEAEILRNSFLSKHAEKFRNLEIIFAYEDNLIIRKDFEVIKFSRIIGNISDFKPHSLLIVAKPSDFSIEVKGSSQV